MEHSADGASSMQQTEQHRVPAAWNDTVVDYPENVCLHHLVAQQAARTPDAVAVQLADQTLSFRALDSRANQLAHHLRAGGVGPDQLVGICIERSLEMVVGLLGILKAGGAYVPMDPEYPAERLAFMLADAQVPILLTQQALLDTMPSHDAETFCLDSQWNTIDSHSTEAPQVDVTADHLAYTIYTSGSTGKPKGAMNSHRAICNRLLWMQDEYELTAADTVLQKTPFSFDVSVWEFFWPLLTGARMVLAKPGGHRDSAYLVDLIDRENVSVLHFVPSMLQLFLTDPNVGRCTSLRDVICSGEALSMPLQEKFFDLLPANLHNLYGPTEAAVDVTYWQCQPGSDLHTVPIGRPVANTQMYILDEQMEPMPVGHDGELYIGGVQVARGYWNRPELTAERFIADPFRSEPGAQLYRTGDVARFLPDGNIEFLGRADHQVKLRGFRIELGEVEAALQRHDSVDDAVVLMREDRLVAYLVHQPGTSATVTALKEFLAVELPDYMIPAAFVSLDEIPLTPNGKRDRQALPAPDQSRPALDQAFEAPRGELEEYLAGLWRDTLSLDQVGRHDRFFDLGGSSLQGAEFVNQVKAELDEFIYITTLFEAPTVVQYAELLEREYGHALAGRFGYPNTEPASAVTQAATDTVTPELLAEARRIIPALPLSTEPEQAPRNGRAIFILAPPRSGTTLLRVMLAGHPDLFSTSELQLLGFNNLGERRDALRGRYALWLEGVIRAVMELKQCTPDAAKEIVAQYENQRMTTREFYGVLQSWLAPKTLVDKSPAYVSDPATLEKAERDFEDAFYVHLTRFPTAMVRSFENYHIAQALYLGTHSYSDRTLGELLWTISHQNTLAFLDSVPAERQRRIQFENLVTDPEATMIGLCEQMGIPFHPELLQPYNDRQRKMTDGLYAESTPMGDTHFHEHGEIKADVADRWRDDNDEDFLGEVTWSVAAELGYQRPSPATPVTAQAESNQPDKRNSRQPRRRQANRQRQLRSGRRNN